MNAGKLRRITFYLMVPVALILIVEGIIYFTSIGFSTIEILLCTLENTCMTFIARPTIASATAFKMLNSDSSTFQRVMASIYVFVVIIAPILTTTAVVAGLQAYILEFRYSLRVSFKEKMFVIGDGSMTKKIAMKYANQYDVQFLMPDCTRSEERVPLLKGKVFAYAAEYKKIVPYLESAKAEKAKSIVINFKNCFDNYKTISDTLEYMIQKSSDEPNTIYILDAPVVYRDVFENLYKGLCIKYKRSLTVLDVKFVDSNEKNVKRFFKNPGFVNKEDKKHHIILTGLGSYGQAMMKGLMQYMIDEGLSGTIDVFDRDLEQNISTLMFSSDSYSVVNDFELVEPVDGARYSVRFNSQNGPITGNFFKASAGELTYAQYLDASYSRSRFDEVFFCIDDISVNFDCYRIISYYADKSDDIRLYFRVGQDLSDSFEAIELMSSKFAHLPDGLPDVNLEELNKK